MVVVRMHEIEAAAPRRLLAAPGPAAARQTGSSSPARCRQAVTHHLRFHPDRVHPPGVSVLRSFATFGEAAPAELRRYACDVTISRCRCFRPQPFSTNSTAR